MPTLSDSVQNAVNRIDLLINEFRAGIAEFKSKADSSLQENKQIVAEAIPTLREWVVDPANGRDTNDGRTLLTAKKTLHAVCIEAAPSTKHLVYLMGDLNQEYFSSTYADIQVRGSVNAAPNDTYRYPLAKRRIVFRPEALNSPIIPGYRVTSALALGSAIGFQAVDIVMADVPDGLSQNEHFRCVGGSLSIDGGDILATTQSNPGRLVSTVSTIPPGIWISGGIAAAARGRIFTGIVAGADPNAGKRYVSNLTTN